MPNRTCFKCRLSFFLPDGEKNIRCPACRSASRDKVCRKCQSPYRDETLKNTRRFCDSCVPAASRPLTLSGKLVTKRVCANKGIDDLASIPAGSQSWWGRLGEILFLHLYPDAQDVSGQHGNRAPYDAHHATLGRVSVKTAQRDHKGAWKFQLTPADHTFLIGFAEGQVVHSWLVPNSHLPAQLKVMNPGSKEYTHREYEVDSNTLAVLNKQFAQIQSLPPPCKRRVDPTQYQHMELGKLGERIYGVINPTSDHVALRNPNSPFDFRDVDGTTVNVRTRRPNGDSRWTWFRSPSPVDKYWFVGLDKQGLTIEVVFAVPESAMPKRGFSYRLGSKTSWDRYRVDTLTHVPVSQFTAPSVQTEIDGLTPEYYKGLTPQAKQDLVNRVVGYLRTQGFPYPLMVDDHKARLEFAQVRKYEAQGDYPASSSGLKFLNPYMPHRYDTRNHAATFSAVGAFQDDTRLRRTVATMLDWERIDLSPSGVRSALTVLNRTPGHFPPAVAYSLVTEFCPDGGTVLDPCAGWGGRLLGTLLAGRQYVGIEAWDATATSLGRIGNRVVELLGSGSYRIVNQPFQGIDPIPADLILTCPPYWTIERYTEQDVDLDEWVQVFVKPFAQKCAECSSRVAMIMQDVTVGRRVIPLVEIWKNAMQTVGYTLIETRQMLRGQFGRATRDHDKVMLWQK